MIGHPTSQHMARALVSYIDCDERVQREIRAEFDSAPSLDTIREIRAMKERGDIWYRRGRDASDADCRGWDWSGDKYRDDMELASSAFVKALERERAA